MYLFRPRPSGGYEVVESEPACSLTIDSSEVENMSPTGRAERVGAAVISIVKADYEYVTS